MAKSNAPGEPALSHPFLVSIAGIQESRMAQRTDRCTTHCYSKATVVAVTFGPTTLAQSKNFLDL